MEKSQISLNTLAEQATERLCSLGEADGVARTLLSPDLGPERRGSTFGLRPKFHSF